MKGATVIAISHRPPLWAASAEREFLKRLNHCPIDVILIRPRIGKRGRILEAQAMREKIPKGAEIIALESDGESLNSSGFARLFNDWRNRGIPPVFLIGGADGLDDSLRQSAKRRLSLSHLTLPHSLARIVLIEQIYRADATLRGHPYPR